LETALAMNGVSALMTLISYLPFEGSNRPRGLSEWDYQQALELTQTHLWDVIKPLGEGMSGAALHDFFTGPHSQAIMAFVGANRRDLSDKYFGEARGRCQSCVGGRDGEGEPPLPEEEFKHHVKMLEFFNREGPNTGSLAFTRVEDEGLDTVVGIAVNEQRKRVTVAFRGTMNLHDWTTHLTTGRISVMLGDPTIGVKMRRIAVHRGFWLRMTHRDKDTCLRFYESIIKPALFDEFENKRDFVNQGPDNERIKSWRQYSLYITGHSLGGALANIMGLLCALDPDIRKWFKGPPTVVAVANPRLGNYSYRELYHELQEKGFLRCVRVLAPDDVVPYVLPVVSGYNHVGARILLYPEAPVIRRDVEFPNRDQFFAYDFTGIYVKSTKEHQTRFYTERIRAALAELSPGSDLDVTIEEIFQQKLPRFYGLLEPKP